MQQIIPDETEETNSSIQITIHTFYPPPHLLLVSGTLEAFPCSLCWHPPPSECNVQASSRWKRKPVILIACLPALSLQTDSGELVGFWSLMAHSLLPGIEMERNVVYLKHSRPPQRKRAQNTESQVCQVRFGETLKEEHKAVLLYFICLTVAVNEIADINKEVYIYKLVDKTVCLWIMSSHRQYIQWD